MHIFQNTLPVSTTPGTSTWPRLSSLRKALQCAFCVVNPVLASRSFSVLGIEFPTGKQTNAAASGHLHLGLPSSDVFAHNFVVQFVHNSFVIVYLYIIESLESWKSSKSHTQFQLRTKIASFRSEL